MFTELPGLLDTLFESLLLGGYFASQRTMPRSFLARQKPNHSELECRDESSATPDPLDFSLLSGLSSSGEENEGRSSNSPIPEPLRKGAPRQRMKFTVVRTHISPIKKEEETKTPVTVAKPVFLCKHCGKEYIKLGALKTHRRSHALPCVCTTCGKVFPRPGQLRGHICKHTKSLQVRRSLPRHSGCEMRQQDIHDNEPDELTT